MTLLMNDARLAEEVALTMGDPRARVLAFGEVAARALHAARPPFLVAKDEVHGRIHAMIVGFGTTGQAIFHDLIVNCRTTYLEKPRIVVIDPAAKALEGVLRVKAPELDHCAECLFIDGQIGGWAVRPGPAEIGAQLALGGPLTAAYVCLGDDQGALSAATMLQSLLRSVDLPHPPIFVRLREATMLAGDPDARSEGLKGLTAFGDIDAVLAGCEFLADEPDAVARRYHLAYQAASGEKLAPWDELRETHRIANRAVVAHMWAKVASCAAPASLGDDGLPKLPSGARLCADDAEMERLAVLEHERWNAERRMDGWRATQVDGKQDPAKRLHPFLQAFTDLPEHIRDYDREFVEVTNTICGGAPLTGPDFPANEARRARMGR